MFGASASAIIGSSMGSEESSTDRRIFAVGMIVIAVHLVDVAVLHPGDAGTPARLALLAGAGLAVALVPAFVRGGRLARGFLAGVTGLIVVGVALAVDIPHAAISGPGGSDFTGILFGLAGLVLVGLAFVISLRGRRLAVKLGFGIPALLVIAEWMVLPALNAGMATHAAKTSPVTANALGIPGARDVTFRARDGVRLAGWYVPGRNGASVILLHGSHGTRTDTLPQLRMLTAAGYGALAYDARGHGQSDGQANALGWAGVDDLAGAADFLARQPGVDRNRIGAVGLSMGAEEALRAAADGIALHAIVADGAGASTLADSRIERHSLAPVFDSVTWLTMRGTELVSGQREPPGLKQIADRIHAPVLLVASGRAGELAIDKAYRDRIGARAQLWYLPDVAHTGGFKAHPQAYTARVVSFLQNALGTRNASSSTP